MKGTIIAAAAAVALLAGCGAGSGATADTSAPATPAATSSSAAPVASKSSSETTDGDWKFGKVVSKSTFGMVTATVRATNITGDVRSGLFTVTYFDKGGNVLGTANGAANTVAANKTVTVQLIGDGTKIDLRKVTKTEIQVDSSF